MSKKEKPRPELPRNFVKKYMDLLTAPKALTNRREYDRQQDKQNLKKEIDRGD